ncbi:hypothetical protein SAMN05428952_11024 [Nitrosomonas sp. Nm132]|jgi:hypothetical protein|nr:hypothetical protein SAMN05428952_11024 [Nitrosomonas sp. Nm132]
MEPSFPLPAKVNRHLDRPPRERGKQIHARSTGKDQVPVLVVRDRSGATANFKLTAIDKKTIKPPLQAILAKDAIFCSDGAAVYRSVVHSLGITHRPVNLAAGIRVRCRRFTIFRTLMSATADSNNGWEDFMGARPSTWKIIWAGEDSWNAGASTTRRSLDFKPLSDEKISFND